jgi:hypothetical protein
MQGYNKGKKLIPLEKYQKKGEKKCKDGYGCSGNSASQTGYGMDMGQGEATKSGTGYFDWKALNNPIGWDQLINYTDPNVEGEKKKVAKKMMEDYTNKINDRVSAFQLPGLDSDIFRVAMGDSDRIKKVMFNPLTGKSDVALNDEYVKNGTMPYDKAWYDYYRSLMNQTTPVTVQQILNFQAQKQGGLGAFKTTVQSNYGKKHAIGNCGNSSTGQR